MYVVGDEGDVVLLFEAGVAGFEEGGRSGDGLGDAFGGAGVELGAGVGNWSVDGGVGEGDNDVEVGEDGGEALNNWGV